MEVSNVSSILEADSAIRPVTRLEQFQAIDPHSISLIDQNVISSLLRRDNTYETNADSSDETTNKLLFENLNFLLSHPDEVDFHLVAQSLIPNISEVEITHRYQEWHKSTLDRLRQTIPQTPNHISDFADLDQYHDSQIPPRAGAFLAGQPNAQAVLLETQMVMFNAAQVALELASNNDVTQLQVIRSIVAGIQSQDKWHILGNPQVGNFYDPITDALLIAMQDKYPEIQSIVSLDTLFRRYTQDPVVTDGLNQSGQQFGSGLFGPYNERETRISQTINTTLAISLSRELTQGYLINRFTDRRAHNIHLTDEILTRPQLRQPDIIIAAENSFTYYDQSFVLPPQFQQCHTLKELQFGLHAVMDDKDQVITFIDTDPRNYDQASTPTEARVYPIEHVLYRHQPDTYPTSDKLTQFSQEYHQVQDQLADLTHTHHAYLVPPPVVFQYWHYCQINQENPDKIQALNEFIKVHNPYGCLLLSAETGSGNTIDDLLDFTQHAHPPAIASLILKTYADMSASFWEQSYNMGEDRSSRTAFADLILDRSKSILNLGLKLHKEGTLEKHAKSLEQIIQVHFLLNAIMQDPSGELAQQYKFPLDSINSIFAGLNPNHPDTKRLLGSTINLWMHTTAAAQTTATYTGRVPELTANFYQLYEQIAADPTHTTVNAEIELPRYKAAIDKAIEQGRLDPSKPIKIAYVGIGSGNRIERHLIDYYNNRFSQVTHLGIEPFAPHTSLAGVEYVTTGLEDVINHPELVATVDHTYLIASPMMDIIEQIKMIDATLGLAHISQMGATVSIDEAFPFGENSYQKEIEAMQQLDPAAPDTLFERTFSLLDGTEFGKPFLASTPTLKHHLMALAGFGTCLNFPTEIDALNYIQKLTTQDDNWITDDNYQADTPQHQAWIDHARRALYRTHDANRSYNRITYEYQKTGEPDFKALLELKNQLTQQAQRYLEAQSTTLAEVFFTNASAPTPVPAHTTA